MLGVWKRRHSFIDKVTLVFKGELKVEEEIYLLKEEEEEEEEEGEMISKVQEDSKEEVDGILQEVTKETSNVTTITSKGTMRENVD